MNIRELEEKVKSVTGGAYLCPNLALCAGGSPLNITKVKVEDLRKRYGNFSRDMLNAQHIKGCVVNFLKKGKLVWQEHPPENIEDLAWICFAFFQPYGWKHIVTSLEEVVCE